MRYDDTIRHENLGVSNLCCRPTINFIAVNKTKCELKIFLQNYLNREIYRSTILAMDSPDLCFNFHSVITNKNVDTFDDAVHKIKRCFIKLRFNMS